MLQALQPPGAAALVPDGNHLDLSYRSTDDWPAIGPAKSLWVRLGDPDVGPAVQFAEMGPIPGEMMLPRHYHGSDQFRMLLRGEMVVAGEHMHPGGFGFQQAGRPYREGPSSSPEGLWLFALMGNGLGARTTWVGSEASGFPLDDVVDKSQMDRPADPGDPSWDAIAGGPKGTTAIATTLGPPSRGHRWSSFADAQSWHAIGPARIAAGALGDLGGGPVTYLVQGDPASAIVPAVTVDTELLIAVARGSCSIGSSTYDEGDVRIQVAGPAMPEITSGPDGVDLVVLLADRRALADLVAAHDDDRAGVAEITALVDDLLAPAA